MDFTEIFSASQKREEEEECSDLEIIQILPQREKNNKYAPLQPYSNSSFVRLEPPPSTSPWISHTLQTATLPSRDVLEPISPLLPGWTLLDIFPHPINYQDAPTQQNNLWDPAATILEQVPVIDLTDSNDKWEELFDQMDESELRKFKPPPHLQMLLNLNPDSDNEDPLKELEDAFGKILESAAPSPAPPVDNIQIQGIAPGPFVATAPLPVDTFPTPEAASGSHFGIAAPAPPPSLGSPEAASGSCFRTAPRAPLRPKNKRKPKGQNRKPRKNKKIRRPGPCREYRGAQAVVKYFTLRGHHHLIDETNEYKKEMPYYCFKNYLIAMNNQLLIQEDSGLNAFIKFFDALEFMRYARNWHFRVLAMALGNCLPPKHHKIMVEVAEINGMFTCLDLEEEDHDRNCYEFYKLVKSAMFNSCNA